MTIAGTVRIPAIMFILQEKRNRMPWDYMIWPVMPGNGAVIGMMIVTPLILQGAEVLPAVPGAVSPAIEAVCRISTMTALAFALSEIHDDSMESQ
jgi:hypothetical protein